MTKTKEPNPPFPVEIIDVVPTEVANPFTKQKATSTANGNRGV